MHVRVSVPHSPELLLYSTPKKNTQNRAGDNANCRLPSQQQAVTPNLGPNPNPTQQHRTTPQGEVILSAGTSCRRFFVVLGAPRELLAVGEVPAVERSEAPPAAAVAAVVGGAGGGGGGGSPPASRRGCRLLAGQYFGEKGLLRQVEVGAAGVVWCNAVCGVA